jgi:hypothetical protein
MTLNLYYQGQIACCHFHVDWEILFSESLTYPPPTTEMSLSQKLKSQHLLAREKYQRLYRVCCFFFLKGTEDVA